MRLIGSFEDPGYVALSEAALAFFDSEVVQGGKTIARTRSDL